MKRIETDTNSIVIGISGKTLRLQDKVTLEKEVKNGHNSNRFNNFFSKKGEYWKQENSPKK